MESDYPPGFWIDGGPVTFCVACGGLLRYFGESGEYHYVRCVCCGTLQLHPLPTKTKLTELYKIDYSLSGHHAESCRTSYPRNKAILDIILSTPPPQGSGMHNVVDLGCGSGCLCRMLHKAKLNYIGLDPSDRDVELCRNTGLNVVKGDLDYLKNGKSISVIVMVAVFEHLVDHAEVLDHCNRILKPGGLLIILSPTAHFAAKLKKDHRDLPKSHNLFCPPWHTVLFSIKGLRYMVQRHGFEIKSVKISPPGSRTGLQELVRYLFVIINYFGFALTERFPFAVSHIFICRKV